MDYEIKQIGHEKHARFILVGCDNWFWTGAGFSEVACEAKLFFYREQAELDRMFLLSRPRLLSCQIIFALNSDDPRPVSDVKGWVANNIEISSKVNNLKPLICWSDLDEPSE